MTSQFIDTNYILRFLLKDEQNQFQKVSNFFTEALSKQIPLVSNLVVLFEVYWVLLKVIKLEKNQAATLLYNFVQLGVVDFPEFDIITNALELDLENNLGLEDNYHVCWCKSQKISIINSFDKNLLKTWNKD